MKKVIHHTGMILLVLFFCANLSAAELLGNIDDDGNVDFVDFALLTARWSDVCFDPNWCEGADIDFSGDVNIVDLTFLTDNWLEHDRKIETIDHAIQFSADQLANTTALVATDRYPRYTQSYASWSTSSASGWTSGFFPGGLWLMYELTDDPNYRTDAQTWTAGLESQKNNTGSHDVGFMIYNSFGNGYRLTGDTAYRDVILQAAESLATRFNPTVGCIRSWDHGVWEYPVIVDNMMNLEILFWASNNGGQAQWYDIAVSHAYKTIENHVRGNGSTYHVVDYNATTGQVISREARQGYADDSTWARGQAWSIYGFTMTYRETGDPNFLDIAVQNANYFIDNLPADHVPFWDFNAPGIPNTERDSSAAAIAASGLLELCTMVAGHNEQYKFYNAAHNILVSLCTSDSNDGYLAEDLNGDPLSLGILMHGCYYHPDSVRGGDGKQDDSMIWGDYYFIEAMLRYKAITPP